MNRGICLECDGTGRIITPHVHSVFDRAECHLVTLCECGQGLTLEQQLDILEGKINAYESALRIQTSN